MWSRTSSAVGRVHLVDDPSVGEEDDPVRVAAAVGSWVTMTTVWPRSVTAVRRKPSTSALDAESRLPVGSSAKTMSGREARARAAATRCC